MPSSPTHNIVRTFQLLFAIIIVATAAFLLHYRTRSHSNFTNEPLASCISGAVAFIYALWAIMNHRRQPDRHQWKYLHALGCLLVCGLLIAGSTLAFVFGKQGVLCQRLKEAQDSSAAPLASPRSTTTTTTATMAASSLSLWSAMVKTMEYPEYVDGREYGPGQICQNTYAEMDRAVAVLGIVAAIFWVLDFCLIFGWCGSSGRYGPHREYPSSSRVGPDEEDGVVDPLEDYYFDEETGQRGHRMYSSKSIGRRQDLVKNASRTSVDHPGNVDDYSAEVMEQRRKQIEWNEHRTATDPRQHVQGPIPLSLKSNYFYSNASLPIDTTGTPSSATASVRREVLGVDKVVDAAPVLPPLPPTSAIRLQEPDSPTLPMTSIPSLPAATSTIATSTEQEITAVASPETTLLNEPELASSPLTPTSAGKPFSPPSAPSPLPVSKTAASASASATHSTLATNSPRYTDFPPGPACYIFDSNQHEYLPSFINAAARHEQLHHQHSQLHGPRTSSNPSTPLASTPATPLTTTPTPSSFHRRIMVTGLGMDLVSRNEAEIEQAEAAGDLMPLPSSAMSPPSYFPRVSPPALATTADSSRELLTDTTALGPAEDVPSETAPIKITTPTTTTTPTSEPYRPPPSRATSQRKPSKLSVVTQTDPRPKTLTRTVTESSLEKNAKASPRSPYVGDF